MFSTLPTLLGLSILLGLLHIVVAATLSTGSRGVGWNLGNRDGEPPPVSPLAARAQRASANFLETFPFFAAAVVAVMAMSRQGDLPEIGAQIYFWARLAYFLIYLIGIPVLRSVVWTVALVGIVIVVYALF